MKTDILEVYAEGTEVVLGNGLNGKITAAIIRGSLIQYEVHWWFEGEPSVANFSDFQFEAAKGVKKIRIGFQHKE